MNLISGILSASRPISWVNTAFPYGAAYLLSGGSLDWLFWVGVLFFLIPYNIAMYGINDVFDYESDIRNPRKGGVEGAVLPKQMPAVVQAPSASATTAPASATRAPPFPFPETSRMACRQINEPAGMV